MTRNIPIDEITFHQSSYLDENGRLFWWEGGLYRAITFERDSFYRELFTTGIVQHLVERKLLPLTELTDLELSGYSAVLKHQVVPFVSYPSEWCQNVLKQAALALLDLQLELLANGRMLHGASPYNVLLNGTVPFYVDFCSIKPASTDGPWTGYREFCGYFRDPLMLMANHQEKVARMILRQGIWPGDVRTFMAGTSFKQALGCWAGRAKGLLAGILPRRTAAILRRGRASLHRRHWRTSDHIAVAQALKRQVESSRSAGPRTKPAKANESGLPSFLPSSEWTQKQRCVHGVLRGLRPDTLLDIGCGTGWFSQLAARNGVTVVAIDSDESAVSTLYTNASDIGLNVLPLVMDFTNPTPGSGMCNDRYPRAQDRLRCDMVLALGFVHHIALEWHFPLEQIARGLAAFSKRWVLVEFIDKQDPDAARFVRTWHKSYSREAFISAMGRHFATMESYPSDSPHRTLLLFGSKIGSLKTD